MATLGQKIRKLRELRNLKQEVMAEKLGISQTAYSKMERDETDVSYERLEQIAKALEISVQDLLSFDEKNFFNIMNNQNAAGYTINQYGLADNEKKLYEDKIRLLEEKCEFLQKEINRINPSK
jgi:transcriptional regulator with XRE-family HTH domain